MANLENKNDMAKMEISADMKILNKKEAAALLRVSCSTIDRWVKDKLLVAVKRRNMNGKIVQQSRVFFTVKDLISFRLNMEQLNIVE